jgi:hypothetical protein
VRADYQWPALISQPAIFLPAGRAPPQYSILQKLHAAVQSRGHTKKMQKASPEVAFGQAV